MITPDQIIDRLTQLPCPICRKTAFALDPRHEPSFAENLHRAICQGCHYRFPVGVPTRPIEQHDQDTAYWLGSLPCPACQKRGVTLDFRCMPNVRASVYFVTCRACRQAFMERSPMEAYE